MTLTRGRVLGIGFGVFALIFLIISWDYGRGRVPVTNSPLINDVLTQGFGRNCGVDATTAVIRHLPVGMARADAQKILQDAFITPPRAMLWTPVMQDRTDLKPDRITALRTIRTSAFGPINLLIEVGLEMDKIARVTGRVVCDLN
jgi:hypothetical protein